MPLPLALEPAERIEESLGRGRELLAALAALRAQRVGLLTAVEDVIRVLNAHQQVSGDELVSELLEQLEREAGILRQTIPSRE